MSDFLDEIAQEFLRKNLNFLVELECQKCGISQAQIAEELCRQCSTKGSKKSTLNRMLKGTLPIRHDTIERICEHFQIPEYMLMSELTEEVLKKLHRPITEKYLSHMAEAFSIFFPVITTQEPRDNENFEKGKDRLNKILRLDPYPTPKRFHFCKQYFSKALQETSHISPASYLLQVLFMEFIFYVIKEDELSYYIARMSRGTLEYHEFLEFFTKKLHFTADYAPYFISRTESYFNECLDVLSNNASTQDLAYYYVAIRYFYGMCYSPDNFQEKQEVGLDLLESLRTMHNPYAERLLAFFNESPLR